MSKAKNGEFCKDCKYFKEGILYDRCHLVVTSYTNQISGCTSRTVAFCQDIRDTAKCDFTKAPTLWEKVKECFK